MLINGFNAVQEALDAGTTIEKIYIEKGAFSEKLRKISAIAKERKIRIFYLEKEELEAMAKMKVQKVLAEITDYKYFTLDEILAQNEKPHLILLLDGVQDPHNLGAIIRVADCAGATGVVIPRHRSVTVNDTVIKTSAGATAHVKIAKVTNINDTIRELQDRFITVFATDMEGDLIYDANLDGDVAIVIGGEGLGVKALTKKLADGVISLPQLGKINSLNASVAAGIVLYEAVRQRI
ncbi:MAG: 23S rRNA (guanosine(2251)-2'-O)-methyltransferase RlmB [Christensenellales bacterium]|jgi:23S rRNA (guanosine2251-2'-O)-methyltransferase|nr:23S rRNA (guanosine(2251)-2'-O)-methyltransferase RlmB [Clostridiales bacterium]